RDWGLERQFRVATQASNRSELLVPSPPPLVPTLGYFDPAPPGPPGGRGVVGTGAGFGLKVGDGCPGGVPRYGVIVGCAAGGAGSMPGRGAVIGPAGWAGGMPGCACGAIGPGVCPSGLITGGGLKSPSSSPLGLG